MLHLLPESSGSRWASHQAFPRRAVRLPPLHTRDACLPLQLLEVKIQPSADGGLSARLDHPRWWRGGRSPDKLRRAARRVSGFVLLCSCQKQLLTLRTVAPCPVKVWKTSTPCASSATIDRRLNRLLQGWLVRVRSTCALKWSVLMKQCCNILYFFAVKTESAMTLTASDRAARVRALGHGRVSAVFMKAEVYREHAFPLPARAVCRGASPL